MKINRVIGPPDIAREIKVQVQVIVDTALSTILPQKPHEPFFLDYLPQIFYHS